MPNATRCNNKFLKNILYNKLQQALFSLGGGEGGKYKIYNKDWSGLQFFKVDFCN